MNPGANTHGKKADPLRDSWSKYECVGEILPIKGTSTENFEVNSTYATESNERTNEHTNGRTDTRKDESYIPLCINAGGITTRNPFFY